MSRLSVASHETTGQVGTYPTRNFATLGTFVTSPCERRLGRFLFRLALHVAVEVGPYLQLPQRELFSVWPLRILSSTSSMGRFRCLPFMFIAYAISTMVASPAGRRCSPSS
jgi:hypothetical protein